MVVLTRATMKMLLRGMENKRRVELMLSLTRINSEPVVKAIFDHLVHGKTEEGAAAINMIQQQNFSWALIKLNKSAQVVEEIKVIDWEKLNQISDVNHD